MSEIYKIDELDYKEASSLINSRIVDRNHDILEEIVNNIEDSVLICENPEIELNPMRYEVFFLAPDFLENSEDPKIIELKENIEIFKEGYESLCKQINDYVEKTSEKLKSLYIPSNNLRNEINDIMVNFEETIKNLCSPLISKKEGFKIDIDKLNENQKDDLQEDKLSIILKINEFKKESDELNKTYNELFRKMSKAVQMICNSIKEIPSTISNFQDKVDEGMSNFEEILEQFSDKDEFETFQSYFNKIKESIKIINNSKNEIIKETNQKINNLKAQYILRKESFNSLKNNSNEIIKNLESKSNSINDDINKVREKNAQKKIELKKIIIPKINVGNALQSIEKAVDTIVNANDSINKEFDIIHLPFFEKTSLDLLIILDITGSMQQYVDEIKMKLLEIIENIEKNSIVININLGFIGYKDEDEIVSKDYFDINFSQNYLIIKNQISNIEVGGGDDTAEDIAWAFECTLKKEWKSNARFAILIADAPCHGLKFHEKNLLDNYPNGVPGRRDIEELVKEMAKCNISLFCAQLKEDTKIMYDIFEDIYEKNKIGNCEFHKIFLQSPKNLVETIVEYASMIYKNKRL